MEIPLLVAMRLSRAGFGTPVEILTMPVNIVLAALEYSTFQDDYETTVHELNKKT